MPKKLLNAETPQCRTLEETRITNVDINNVGKRHHSDETSTNKVEIG